MRHIEVRRLSLKKTRDSLTRVSNGRRFGGMNLDLEQYRLENGLSYAKLAEKIGLRQSRHAMRWALGESWPDADKLQRIVEITDGAVTIDAMHRRRLGHLASQT